MSTINPGNTLGFKSTDSLFARVRKRLKSYDAVGLLDEGDWYWYIKELVDKLGVSVYDECEAIITVKDYKGPMPENFSYLYAAYKCTPNEGGSKQTVFPQTGFVFYIEEIHQPYRQCKNCYSAKRDYVDGEKLTIRTYIEGQPRIINFTGSTLLQLAGTTRGMCHDKCKNMGTKSLHQISINKDFLHTNFQEDAVYMKYYGLAIDPESGLPMIPDNTFVEKAIEDYIVYRCFEDMLLNAEVPDIQNRYGLVKANYEDSLKQAMYWAKMPSFQNAINKIRSDRTNLSIYQQW